MNIVGCCMLHTAADREITDDERLVIVDSVVSSSSAPDVLLSSLVRDNEESKITRTKARENNQRPTRACLGRPHMPNYVDGQASSHAIRVTARVWSVLGARTNRSVARSSEPSLLGLYLSMYPPVNLIVRSAPRKCSFPWAKRDMVHHPRGWKPLIAASQTENKVVILTRSNRVLQA